MNGMVTGHTTHRSTHIADPAALSPNLPCGCAAAAQVTRHHARPVLCPISTKIAYPDLRHSPIQHSRVMQPVPEQCREPTGSCNTWAPPRLPLRQGARRPAGVFYYACAFIGH